MVNLAKLQGTKCWEKAVLSADDTGCFVVFWSVLLFGGVSEYEQLNNLTMFNVNVMKDYGRSRLIATILIDKPPPFYL